MSEIEPRSTVFRANTFPSNMSYLEVLRKGQEGGGQGGRVGSEWSTVSFEIPLFGFCSCWELCIRVGAWGVLSSPLWLFWGVIRSYQALVPASTRWASCGLGTVAFMTPSEFRCHGDTPPHPPPAGWMAAVLQFRKLTLACDY